MFPSSSQILRKGGGQITEAIFKNRKPNEQKLLSFGFDKREGGYVCQRDIADGQMRLTLAVSPDGRLFSEIVDRTTGEEYILHRVPNAAGSFVGRVKAEYEAVLDEISARCFDVDVFRSEQAREIIAYIRDRYGDELEFLWQKFPDNAVVRRKDNRKWYAAILTVSRRKLGFDLDESTEIIDLRMKPEDIEKTVDGVKYLPGYHMNKKHWITICLDGTVSTDEIRARIDSSYELARK